MSIDADAPGATSDGSAGIPWRDEERAEHLGPVVADSRQEPERHPGTLPLPGHVEHAAAGQHEVAADVDVEAQRAEQRQRPLVGLGHSPASGPVRASTCARNRS